MTVIEGLVMSQMECFDCGLMFEDDLSEDVMSCPECGSFNVDYTGNGEDEER